MSSFVLAIHWSFFGPFHLARLNAAFRDLGRRGIEIVGLEMTPHKKLFCWEHDDGPTPFRRYVAMPNLVFEKASPLQKYLGVVRKLNEINPDAVAINGYSDWDALGAVLWCKVQKRKAIITSDSKFNDAPRSFYKEFFKKLILRKFDSALCAGSFSRSYLESLGMQPRLIFEGLDVVDNEFFSKGAVKAKASRNDNHFLPGLENNKPFFLASSRLIRIKNIDGLIRAYAQYRLTMENNNLKPWRLVILGDGCERSALMQLAQSLNLQEITFAGFHQINDLPIYYGLAKFFIHCTWGETWGLVVNEAMAAGLPVIVSNRAGCVTDLIEDGKSGFTFYPEDTETLVNLMVKVSSGSMDLETMSRAAQESVSHWGLQRFVDGLYQAVNVVMH